MSITAAGSRATPSPANQTRSDADQASSARDKARADADQVESQRDLAASNRDRSLRASTDARFLEALAAIHAARAGSVAEREAAAADRVRAAEDRDVAAVDRNRAALDREQVMDELEKAQLDDLTGFFRLGLGTAVLQREIDRSRRSDGAFVLAYCDVDGLKQVNDEQGHAAGDALLKGMAEAIRSRLRSYDPVVRVGGDEFVCGLSEIAPEQADKIFHGIQHDFAKGWNGASVSYGLAALRPDDSLATLLERSDRALRQARSAST